VSNRIALLFEKLVRHLSGFCVLQAADVASQHTSSTREALCRQLCASWQPQRRRAWMRCGHRRPWGDVKHSLISSAARRALSWTLQMPWPGEASFHGSTRFLPLLASFIKIPKCSSTVISKPKCGYMIFLHYQRNDCHLRKSMAAIELAYSLDPSDHAISSARSLLTSVSIWQGSRSAQSGSLRARSSDPHPLRGAPSHHRAL